jgi:hypothetical protein
MATLGAVVGVGTGVGVGVGVGVGGIGVMVGVTGIWLGVAVTTMMFGCPGREQAIVAAASASRGARSGEKCLVCRRMAGIMPTGCGVVKRATGRCEGCTQKTGTRRELKEKANWAENREEIRNLCFEWIEPVEFLPDRFDHPLN